MERVNSMRITSPTDVLVSSFCRGKPQDINCQLDDFDMNSMNSASVTTVNGGSQNAPDIELPMSRWPPESFRDYPYPGYFDDFQIQEPGNAAFDGDMGTNQIADPERGHLMSVYNLPPRDHDVPRILLDQTDKVPPIMERDCHLTEQPLISREVMFGVKATAGNTTTQNIDWLQGHQAVNQASQYIVSGLKPHVRPCGLGNEYVPYTLDHARCTDLKLLPDHQATGFNNNLAHWPNTNDSIADTKEFLRPNGTNLGRRKSVPHRRLRKLSSVDQGIHHFQLAQERTQIAGTQVFDTNMKIKPGRKKRRFSEGEKERIARVRKIGACQECRLKKRRVWHS